ncbi:MAG: excinuclease ABC subunit C [Marinilabiliales bacterium]|nr:MAG: excinuclease ABC subunit C [Marinilabiliales bacterium]
MKYTTYILFSNKLGKFYTGQTDDLDRRIEEHNLGKTPFMKTGLPWSIVFQKSFKSRADAMELEKKIKKRGAKRYLNDNNITVG